jgi:cytochrome c-type biogenesis protein CcmE
MSEEIKSTANKGIRWGWIVAALIVIVILAFFSMKGSSEAVQYYMTVSEYYENQPKYEAKKVKLAGKVKKGSLQKEGTTYHFVVQDLGKSIHVIYAGLAPDTFKDESDVVIEGLGRRDDIFEAASLMAKCASKYTEGGLPPLEKMRGQSRR